MSVIKSRFINVFAVSVVFLLTVIVKSSFAQSVVADDVEISVNSSREDAVCKVDEKIEFHIHAKKGGIPLDGTLVEWELISDEFSQVKSGSLQLSEGRGIVVGEGGRPGFLKCKVVCAIDGKEFVASASVGVSPLEITPSSDEPIDFQAFWRAKLKLLGQVPLDARLNRVSMEQKQVFVFDTQVDSLGAPVSGYLSYPKDVEKRSLPAIIILQGAGVAGAGLDGAIGWAERGFLAFSINAHGISNGRPAEYYAELEAGPLKDYPKQGSASRETVYFRDMFLRVIRAIDFLTSRPEWNGQDVVVYGCSQGGAQAIAAAGIDARVTFCAAGVPAMCDHSGVSAGREPGWPKAMSELKKSAFREQVESAFRYYDGVNFARHIRASSVFTVGFLDVTCPPAGVYAAYNQLRGEKAIFNDITTGHRNSPEADDFMTRAILSHVKRSND